MMMMMMMMTTSVVEVVLAIAIMLIIMAKVKMMKLVLTAMHVRGRTCETSRLAVGVAKPSLDVGTVYLGQPVVRVTEMQRAIGVTSI
ncbi:hypothetical protein ElyMa_002393700 [Elysia marginata]|uniref:Secreted protein n=1 Tax=Elysia marginata TaxID=1093978 RepID=A0AAV4GEG3_9GAST|nr:hypothetical protein ElyMa_002393700 [Elysia marginata]